MPSRHARSHAGFVACALAGIIIVHMAAHATKATANERAEIHRMVFKFIPLLEIPTGLARPHPSTADPERPHVLSELQQRVNTRGAGAWVRPRACFRSQRDDRAIVRNAHPALPDTGPRDGVRL